MVAAGGRGERSGSSTLKQFTQLGGRPLFVWSLEALAKAGCDPLILVAPADSIDEASSLLPPGIKADVVKGGRTRQESVANGLQHINTRAVVVHDAARPFLSPDTVRELGNVLEGSDAVIPVIPVKETVKEIEGLDVVRTVDRSRLVLSQTPQMFLVDSLRVAHERAVNDGYLSTDDAQLVERYGGSVKTIPGSRRNIKLTYPEDFELAESILRMN